MAFFDKEELTDCVRHNLALLDDTGLTARIVPPPRRRPPADGLPLEFVRERRLSQIDEQDEENDDLQQQQPSLRQLLSLDQQLDEPCTSSSVAATHQPSSPPHSSFHDQIRSRLMDRLAELEEGGAGTGNARGGTRAVQCAGQRPATPCLISFEPRDPMTSMAAGTSNSMDFTRLFAETKFEEASIQYAEFAKFEAVASSPNSKRFAIVFPWANCAIPIEIVKSATIGDLIGLACHVYSRQHRREPPCDLPSNYDLYLAEEDTLEFDMELPPQDRRRRVADCGFPALAMVARSSSAARRHSQTPQLQAKIFLTDGRTYTMDLDSLDVSLQQVFDYAMERKKADDEAMSRFNPPDFMDPGYILEPMDHPGHPLDLSGSVSSSGTTEFVLLRRNSSRGELLITTMPKPVGAMPNGLSHSRSMMDFSREHTRVGQLQVAGGSKPSTPTTGITTAEMDWSKRRNRFSVQPPFLLQQQLSFDSLATLNRTAGTQMLIHGDELDDRVPGIVLEEYEVNRIHRFHPKTPSKLVVRDRCVELIPTDPTSHENHRRKMSKFVGKTKRIPLELVAAIEVPPHSEQRSNARRTVRIIWLGGTSPALNHYLITHQEQAEESAVYHGSYWKTLLIDAAAHEAWNIGVKLSELLDLRRSPVQMIYQHSAGATLKPFASAEKAFGSSKSNRRTGSSTTTVGEAPAASSSSSSWKDNTVKMAKSDPDRHSHTRKKLSQLFSRKRH